MMKWYEIVTWSHSVVRILYVPCSAVGQFDCALNCNTLRIMNAYNRKELWNYQEKDGNCRYLLKLLGLMWYDQDMPYYGHFCIMDTALRTQYPAAFTDDDDTTPVLIKKTFHFYLYQNAPGCLKSTLVCK